MIVGGVGDSMVRLLAVAALGGGLCVAQVLARVGWLLVLI